MINGMRITKTESQAYMHPDEVKNHKKINIAYDFSLDEPRLIKSKTGLEDVFRVNYKFSIIYTNPSMGYLRYQGEVDCPIGTEKIENITEELRNEIATNIIINILPLALLSSRLMGLPPAVPLPFPPQMGEKKERDFEVRGYE